MSRAVLVTGSRPSGIDATRWSAVISALADGLLRTRWQITIRGPRAVYLPFVGRAETSVAVTICTRDEDLSVTQATGVIAHYVESAVLHEAFVEWVGLLDGTDVVILLGGDDRDKQLAELGQARGIEVVTVPALLGAAALSLESSPAAESLMGGRLGRRHGCFGCRKPDSSCGDDSSTRTTTNLLSLLFDQR